MPPKSTVHHFTLELSDIDRDVYGSFKLPVALHPSESLEFMVTRVIAWALEYSEGISFSAGLGATEDPAISVRGPDGSLLTWIEVGAPNADRLHRAAKAAKRVAVYCHRSAEVVFEELSGSSIFRGEEIAFYSFEGSFITDLTKILERRNDLSISRSDQTLYVTLNGESFSSGLVERRLSAGNKG